MIKSSQSRERGQELVEFALTLPILFMVLMGIFDMGRATYYNSVLYNAAREGTRYGVIGPYNPGGIETAARKLAIGLDPGILTVSSAYNASAKTIRVTMTYVFTPVTPVVASFYGADSVTITSQATMRTEH